jgi:thymidylate synthase
MVAQQTGLGVGDFVWTGGDCHLYRNHLEQADLQLGRQPLALPRMALRRRPDSLFEYRYEDFELLNYEYHPHIRAAVAV